jgi:CBS domain
VPTLPIRSLEVIDEQTRVHLHVFCPRRRAATSVEVCRSCQHFTSDGQGGVTCDAPPRSSGIGVAGEAGLFIGPDAVTATVYAGDLLGPRTIAVRYGACGLAEEELLALRAVVVLDDSGRPIETLVGRDAVGLRTLPESASLYDALDLMIHHQTRFVQLVDAEGRLVGLLRDVDVLRWVADLRRSNAR